MTIQRLKTHTKDFVILYKQVINDPKLSWKAVGIWTYLMGLPDDWKINCSDLANRHSDGYKSTLSGLNELVKNGYAYKRNKHTLDKQDDGKFLGGCWVIFEEKTDLKEFESKLKKSLPYGPFGYADNGYTHKGELLSIEEPSIEKTKERESLISFGEFVKLTQSQYDHFVSQENKSFIDDVIDDINNYCESSGKKYKSFKGAVSTFIKKKKSWDTQNNKNKKSGVSKNEFDRRWHKAKEAIRELEKKGMTATELGIKDIKSGIVVSYDHIDYPKFLQKIGFYYILN